MPTQLTKTSIHSRIDWIQEQSNFLLALPILEPRQEDWLDWASKRLIELNEFLILGTYNYVNPPKRTADKLNKLPTRDNRGGSVHG